MAVRGIDDSSDAAAEAIPLPATVRALLIDALGTLVWLAPPAPVLGDLLVERFGVEASAAELTRAIRAEMSHYRAHMNEGRDSTSLLALHERCGEILRGALPPHVRRAIPPGPASTRLLLDALRFHAFDDARPTLAAARAAGVRIVVASNWDASLPDVLHRTGLIDLLDGVVTSATVGAPKPAEAVFGAALALAGAAPHEAVHVGDTPGTDVAGATAAGIAPILLVRGGERPVAVVPIVDSLEALPGLLGWSLSSNGR